MLNFQAIIFIRTRTYKDIFKFALMHLLEEKMDRFHWRCSIKKTFRKNFEYLQELLKLFCNFITKRLQHKCFPVNIGKLLRTPTLNNISVRMLLKLLQEVIVQDFLSAESLSNHTDLLILQKYQLLSIQNALHFTLNIGFLCSSLTVTTEKANSCSQRTSCCFTLASSLSE